MSSSPFEKFTITRYFEASPERIFDACVKPATARLWLFTSPDTDIANRRVEIDARIGGKWLMTNPIPEMTIEGLGEYLEIDRPRRLVFTFAIPMFEAGSDTIVIEIAPKGSGCVLTLSHQELPLDQHEAIKSGWEQMFDRLDAALQEVPG